jgi:hypothetical protein
MLPFFLCCSLPTQPTDIMITSERTPWLGVWVSYTPHRYPAHHCCDVTWASVTELSPRESSVTLPVLWEAPLPSAVA